MNVSIYTCVKTHVFLSPLSVSSREILSVLCHHLSRYMVPSGICGIFFFMDLLLMYPCGRGLCKGSFGIVECSFVCCGNYCSGSGGVGGGGGRDATGV